MKINNKNESQTATKAGYIISLFALIFASDRKQKVLESLVFKMSLMASTKMFCIYCNEQSCIRRGLRGVVQKLFCKTCKRWHQNAYKNHSYGEQDENQIRIYHNEGLGTSSIGRLLKIPRTSVQMLMERKAAKLSFVFPEEEKQTYLMDELQTFVEKNNEQSRYYVISIMNKVTGEIIESITGRRTQAVMRPMMERLLKLNPKQILTDGWNGYQKIIPESVHRILPHCINRLERFHLTLRQHIKRLARKTMSFSKSERLLEVSLKLFCC